MHLRLLPLGIASLFLYAQAFPSLQLASLDRRGFPGAQPPVGPNADTSSKLVDDAAHPWKPLRKGDIRGPCPGLNTLASHGYLPRSGIATPAQIVTAVQEGFNMHNDIASFVTYAAHLVDGNQLTNLLSIGSKTPRTGPAAPAPAIVGGLDTHGVFEGDASTTRGDAYFGDNHSFNETLFQQLVNAAKTVGNGTININSAALHRFNRIQDSIARNPTFDFTSPRFTTAYAETVFPLAFFVDGRKPAQVLSIEDARMFFQEHRFPKGFHRREGAFGFEAIGPLLANIYNQHPVLPGRNNGANNYTVDAADPGLGPGDFTCYVYHKHINRTLASLYPNPQGQLRAALRGNAQTWYSALGEPECEQLFPFEG